MDRIADGGNEWKAGGAHSEACGAFDAFDGNPYSLWSIHPDRWDGVGDLDTRACGTHVVVRRDLRSGMEVVLGKGTADFHHSDKNGYYCLNFGSHIGGNNRWGMSFVVNFHYLVLPKIFSPIPSVSLHQIGWKGREPEHYGGCQRLRRYHGFEWSFALN